MNRFSAFLTIVSVLACGNDKKPPPPPPEPEISDINSTADPKSPVGETIEINGTHFLATPGKVRFSDGTNNTDLTPDASGWSDISIVLTIPDTLTPNTTVTVFVITANGTSNGVDLDIVDVPSFNSSSSLEWGDSVAPALPEGLRGLEAAVVPHTDTHAYLYVCGGQTSAGTPANRDTCSALGLMVDGATFSTDASWTSESALPEARAFFQLVAAHPQNSPVTSPFLYAIGGQAQATDAPGGTVTVYRASVDVSDGTLGSWSSAATLPAARWGHQAFVYRSDLFVLGGYDATGAPQDEIFKTRISPDGSLDAFEVSPSVLPVATGSFAAFAFGGKVYIVGGETSASTNPNDGSEGAGDTRESYYSQIARGEIGPFTATTRLGNERKKHVIWNSFGSALVAEGAQKGSTADAYTTDIQTDGTFGSWNGTSEPAADVFNCAAVLSPVSPVGGGPRFILLGGDDFAGNAVATVWVNTLP